MFLKRAMSGSARMSTGKLFQTTVVLRRKMHLVYNSVSNCDRLQVLWYSLDYS